MVGNSQFDKAGNYNISLTNSSGCDSLIELNVSIFPEVVHFLDTTICESEVLNVWGRNYNQAGLYEFTQKIVRM